MNMRVPHAKEWRVKEWKKERLTVRVFNNRSEMGIAAAKDFALAVERLLKTKDTLNVVYAAAPSQNEFLRAMANDARIDFRRIAAFHMDEYTGLSTDSPRSFGSFLKNAIFDRVPFKEVHLIKGDTKDPDEEARRYSRLLATHPIDIVCMGIGENGHIAFNDPSVADFNDPLAVKVVELEETCRLQQVHDKCFPQLSEVPTHALTLTIPTLASATYHFCVVPASSKTKAVHDTLNSPISTACPATVMRTWGQPVLYLDPDSARMLHD